MYLRLQVYKIFLVMVLQGSIIDACIVWRLVKPGEGDLGNIKCALVVLYEIWPVTCVFHCFSSLAGPKTSHVGFLELKVHVWFRFEIWHAVVGIASFII